MSGHDDGHARPLNQMLVAVLNQRMEDSGDLARAMTAAIPDPGVDPLNLAIAAATMLFVAMTRVLEIANSTGQTTDPCLGCSVHELTSTMIAIARANGMKKDGSHPDETTSEWGPMGKPGAA